MRATRSTIALQSDESSARDDVLPAGRRRRSAEAAQVCDAPARAGIETHVLAPDDPKWLHSDPGLAPPTQAWIHRARYLGPRARRLADELHGRRGLDRLTRQATSLSSRVLVPDENVAWNLTAIPAALRIVRAQEIDVVLTTSPPNSVHLVGAAVKRTTGVRWVADLRDSVGAHPHRNVERTAVRVKEKVSESVARLVARQADAIVAASDAI